MLALRNLLKPRLITQAVRPLAIRALSTPVVHPNTPPSPHTPVTTSPQYNIKESQLKYQVDMDVPKEFGPEEVTVEIDPDTKRIHVTGVHKEAGKQDMVFEKDFASGHALDVDHMQADLIDGHLHVEANKVYTPPPPLLADTPISAAPGYDILESPWKFAVDMNLPPGFTSHNVQIQFLPDAKGVNIMGQQDNVVFHKLFSCGRAMDVKNFKTVVEQGYLHFEAPKMYA